MLTFFRSKGRGVHSCRAIAEKMETETEVVRKGPSAAVHGDFVVRWGTTAEIPSLPSTVTYVANTADAIRKVSNKGMFRKLLSDEGLAPKTWVNQFVPDDCPDSEFIVRPLYHMAGQNLYHCDSKEGVRDCVLSWDLGGFYVSEYIKKDREFRVVVSQGRVLYVYEKLPEDRDEVAWNFHAEGATSKVQKWSEWDLSVCSVAISAFNLSGLDFGAVDVILKDGKAYCLEINTSPDVSSEYRQSVLAKSFDFMYKNGLERMTHDSSSWKGMIHPVMYEGQA